MAKRPGFMVAVSINMYCSCNQGLAAAAKVKHSLYSHTYILDHDVLGPVADSFAILQDEGGVDWSLTLRPIGFVSEIRVRDEACRSAPLDCSSSD
jgi:hypothetical protein